MIRKTPQMEFHISRRARDRYQFEESLFAFSGNAILADFHAVRVFAQKINDRRDLIRFPEQAVKAGQIHAMGLIDEILHVIIALYREQIDPRIMGEAMDWLIERFGEEKVDRVLDRFVDEFPPVAVYQRRVDRDTYVKGETSGIPHRWVAMEEMLMLHLANKNPAFSPFIELFDDTALEHETAYLPIVAGLHEFFKMRSPFGPNHQNLVDMLGSPAEAVPYSLEGQLEYVCETWGTLLDRYFYRLLGGLDLIKEEEKMRFAGPGPAQIYEFTGLEAEPEHFSLDLEWMPQLVMIAKNTYVWLDQLSKKYQRPITRLDQIPDEELDRLAGWGFSGLWLIGLWERSRASQKIKQLCGNPDAVASAYSIFDYEIAADVGGEEAYQDLRDRVWKRGIRLASDMVPNHMGIDARWVIEHPDWFISLPHPPFPSYTFDGQDLSWDERVGIFLEDHYSTRTDAAVVFKRLDLWTGSERYLYHGNDGTRMPWNDTAQLNYLHPDVREAVIQTILHVARRFPIIRFDAAMTLTKRHYQRLWYPEPGSGGDIPSRAGQGLTKAEFDRAMPDEFWRQVVDRVTQEVPDTLLLAEAFWLMEGYFVRTLGMHRVYNSAFMNMLKNEENEKYRTVIKNVLEFNPEVLKRFVNFMNNPDEETAVAQFGKGDKYFGVCVMMVTMPGLPMFGHGQIEGLTEKYGMEYRRAHWDEEPDTYVVERHKREIFPLMRRRYLFADAQNFILYDFFAPEGSVNEDVFAYSNRVGDERALVVYHNRYATARGWIRISVAYSVNAGEGDERTLVQRNLGEGLGLRADDDSFCLFRDQISGLEYIRNNKKLYEKGLYLELGAYKYDVFVDFREIRDNAWHHYACLETYLGGRGVPSIEEALRETFLQPIHHPFEELMNAGVYRRFIEARIIGVDQTLDQPFIGEVEEKMEQLLGAVEEFTGIARDGIAIAREVRRKLEAILQLSLLKSERQFTTESTEDTEKVTVEKAVEYIRANLNDDPFIWGSLLGWLAVHALGKLRGETDFAQQSRSWIDEWLLGKRIAGMLGDIGMGESETKRAVTMIKVLTSHQRWFETPVSRQKRMDQVVESLLKDDDVQQFLQVNRYKEVLWFNKEAFEQLLWWMFLLVVVEGRREEIVDAYGCIQELHRATEASGYQVEKLLAVVEKR